MIKKLLLVVLLAAATGCATNVAPPEERLPIDPWEPFNRSVYSFNRAADRAVLRPVARGYTKVTPRPVQTGVSNFFTNLRSPVVIVNLLLQGRPADSGEQLKRFFVNTVYGIGGLFDVAGAADMPEFQEDFGQTLATWGWENSRFVMLPLLGPSTVRDTFGRGADTASDVTWRLALQEGSWALITLNVIDIRAGLLPLDRELAAAHDEYAFIRDGWMQMRNFQIRDGEVDVPDYEDFLDDDDWDDWD